MAFFDAETVDVEIRWDDGQPVTVVGGKIVLNVQIRDRLAR